MTLNDYPYEMDIRIIFDNADEPTAIYKIIRVEKHKFDRSKASINLKNNLLSINIIAKDSKALKATFNTYLKLVSVLHKIWTLKIKEDSK
ncbi:MAG: hypothetical protein DRO04_00555 [Candidatus Iainarchaeum archaeon]|uniref:KEOPS complex Pcc1-like subunit n=1 Tax=Candidatus Iainarchaeum sp. TaxID=3101447 RepID=A0A497JJ29_9ARCH|nr:MAG: hypothetical protein DRO04_00555 [Candidatus Diapherotrites archaeon]